MAELGEIRLWLKNAQMRSWMSAQLPAQRRVGFNWVLAVQFAILVLLASEKTAASELDGGRFPSVWRKDGDDSNGTNSSLKVRPAIQIAWLGDCSLQRRSAHGMWHSCTDARCHGSFGDQTIEIWNAILKMIVTACPDCHCASWRPSKLHSQIHV